MLGQAEAQSEPTSASIDSFLRLALGAIRARPLLWLAVLACVAPTVAFYTLQPGAYREHLIRDLPLGVTNAVTLVACSALLVVIDWRLALGSMVLVALVSAAPRWLGPGADRASGRVNRQSTLLASTIQEALGPPAVQHVSFSIPRGSRVAIVGPSGSGKSTSLLDRRGGYARLWARQQGVHLDAATGWARVDPDWLMNVPLFQGLEGSRLLVERLTPRFGELALMRDGVRSATMRALAPSVLLSLSRADFADLLKSTPELASRLEQRVLTYTDGSG